MKFDIPWGVALAEEMDVGSVSEVAFFEEGSGLARIEHLLHETLHALLLCMEPSPGMDDPIGILLAAKSDRGLHDEALVLAAEDHLFRDLGEPLDPSELRCVASIQGVDSRMLADALASSRARELADEGLAWALKVRLVVEGSVKLPEPASGG